MQPNKSEGNFIIRVAFSIVTIRLTVHEIKMGNNNSFHQSHILFFHNTLTASIEPYNI